MKARRSVLSFLLPVAMIPLLSRADLIEKRFTDLGTKRVITGTVLQGSKNMRDLGKRSTLDSDISVVSPVFAVPGFAPPVRSEAREERKPRFGYGSGTPSDGRTQKGEFPVMSVSEEYMGNGEIIISDENVFEFHPTYPVHREFYFAPPPIPFLPINRDCGEFGFLPTPRFFAPPVPFSGSRFSFFFEK